MNICIPSYKNRQTKLLQTTVQINFILVGLFRIHLQLSFGHMLTFIRYIESSRGIFYVCVSGLCSLFNEDFVKSRFVISRISSIHLILILVGLKKIVRHTENFVMQVKSRFHCTGFLFQCFVHYCLVFLFCFVLFFLFNLVLLSCLRPRCLLQPFSVFLFQTNQQIKIVDNMIGRLWSGLKDRSLEDKINIILVSDHGKCLFYKGLNVRSIVNLMRQ